MNRLLALEPLGPRLAPAVLAAADPGGHLFVTSDSGDAIAVSTSAGQVRVNGADPSTGPLAAGSLTALTITGSAAANAIDLSALLPSAFPLLRAVSLTGGGGGDRLAGPDLAKRWLVTGPDSGQIDGDALASFGPILFAAFAELTGGGGDDHFAFAQNGSLSGPLDGAGGNDVLDLGDRADPADVLLVSADGSGFGGSASGAGGFRGIGAIIGGTGADRMGGIDQDAVWLFDDTGTYQAAGLSLGFSSFEVLAGGAGRDNFVLTGGSLGVVSADLTGGGGDDEFDLRDGVAVSGGIDGGPGQDRLTWAGYGAGVAVRLLAVTADGFAGDEGSLGGGFLGIDILAGAQTGGDSLTGPDLSAEWRIGLGGSLLAGGAALGFEGFAVLAGGGLDDALTVEGSPGDDTVIADAARIVRSGPAPLELTISSFARVAVRTGAGADRIDVTPGVGVSFEIDAGSPAPPTDVGDIVTVRTDGTTAASLERTGVGAGVYTFADRGPVRFAGAENFSDDPPVPPAPEPPSPPPPDPPSPIPPAPGPPPAPEPVPPIAASPIAYAAGAGPGGLPLVSAYDETGRLRFTLLAFDTSFRGGVSVAMADVTGDGLADLIAAAGPGVGPHVKVFDGLTGAQVASFWAFDPAFGGGVTVAAADLNGDGRAEIICGAGSGGIPVVVVIEGSRLGQLRPDGRIADSAVVSSFLAYDEGFRGGVSLAVARSHGGSGWQVLAGAGAGGMPLVRAFSITGEAMGALFAYDPAFRGGVSVAAADFTGDGVDEIVTGAGPGGAPHVKLFRADTSALIGSFFAFPIAFTGGVNVAAGGLGDAPSIFAGAGPGGLPVVNVVRPSEVALGESFYAYDPVFTGGVAVAAAPKAGRTGLAIIGGVAPPIRFAFLGGIEVGGG